MGNKHIVRNVRKHCGSEKISLEVWDSTSSVHQLCALVDPTSTKLQQFVKVRLVVLRPVGRRAVKWVPDCHGAQILKDASDKFVVYPILHEKPSSGDAVLSFIKKHRGHALNEKEEVTVTYTLYR